MNFLNPTVWILYSQTRPSLSTSKKSVPAPHQKATHKATLGCVVITGDKYPPPSLICVILDFGQDWILKEKAPTQKSEGQGLYPENDDVPA